MGASVGIIIAYILKFTGYDYYILKGLGIGAFYWIATVGFGFV
jgi:hypothetical protein